jgi:hypothetical protein
MENAIKLLSGYVHKVQNNFPVNTIFLFPYPQVITI